MLGKCHWRSFEIDEGDPYNEILYNKNNNIKNLGFKNLGVIEEGTSDQNKVINITVEEKATGEISLEQVRELLVQQLHLE